MVGVARSWASRRLARCDGATSSAEPPYMHPPPRARLEAHLIGLALARTGGNRTQAARLLDISYKALAYKVRDYGLDKK